MVFEVKRQIRENSQGLVRRFTKRIRQSGLLLRVRRSYFRQPTLSKKGKKKAALRRKELKKEYEKMNKASK